MKAIVQDRYGEADVLEFRDVEEPQVGEKDVLIRVRAAGAGPDVWHIMAGKPYMARPVLGWSRPKIRIRGWDVAGTVEAVGSAVTEFARGEEVMGEAQRGSFAELTVAPADTLVRKPSRISFEQAAAVPVSGTTAIQALRDKGHVQPGQSVLVIGAAGGVGTFTVQIAKAMGATVTGVASTSKLDLVRSIGADDVIDYTREDFADGSQTWDVIVDTAGRRPLRELRRALSRRARWWSLAAMAAGTGPAASSEGCWEVRLSRCSSARRSARSRPRPPRRTCRRSPSSSRPARSPRSSIAPTTSSRRQMRFGTSTKGTRPARSSSRSSSRAAPQSAVRTTS
jgi:NADPH:quinone reductase-like Zn-dependent oxidoreductase